MCAGGHGSVFQVFVSRWHLRHPVGDQVRCSVDSAIPLSPILGRVRADPFDEFVENCEVWLPVAVGLFHVRLFDAVDFDEKQGFKVTLFTVEIFGTLQERLQAFVEFAKFEFDFVEFGLIAHLVALVWLKKTSPTVTLVLFAFACS